MLEGGHPGVGVEGYDRTGDGGTHPLHCDLGCCNVCHTCGGVVLSDPFDVPAGGRWKSHRRWWRKRSDTAKKWGSMWRCVLNNCLLCSRSLHWVEVLPGAGTTATRDIAGPMLRTQTVIMTNCHVSSLPGLSPRRRR